MRDDGAEYRLHNRRGPFAHGQAAFRVRPHGLLADTWAMLRFLGVMLCGRIFARKTLP